MVKMIEIKIDQETAQVTCKGKPIDNLAETTILVQEAFRLGKTIGGGKYYDAFKALVFTFFLNGTFDKFASEASDSATTIQFCSPRFTDSDLTEEGDN